MHNWFEGVLQHHFQFRWGLNGNRDKKNRAVGHSERSGAESSNYVTENDLSNSEEEEDDHTDEVASLFLSVAQKEKLDESVLDVVVPTGITQMPRGLGTKKNGKLKASEWHTLFAIHLPLALLDIFLESGDIDEDLRLNQTALDNICALVRCTNLVSSKRITGEDANQGLISARQPPWRTPICTPSADWRARLHANLLLGRLACSWRAGLHAKLGPKPICIWVWDRGYPIGPRPGS
ncbi:hypothetical protein PGTUg99_016125 [Puccinia graminis f. sp. tritici]|uniref:Uncharacterized protein n=1 Tax=Puccinia graminis f. sp. tritici TaxID=56615 RepID=A0A5B0R6S7_PUCGR|nr:hypothetical protein PGTUg99_016125 [Puccinia graminis f. sp. tritici]